MTALNPVVGLEWTSYDNTSARVRTAIGIYAACEAGWWLDGGDTQEASSLEAAKAAAEADYQSRILSCLTPEARALLAGTVTEAGKAAQWREDFTGMVRGEPLYEGQQLWVRWEDHLAALALAQPGAGWKLVPEEPTEAMLAAAGDVDLSNDDERGAVFNLWHTMLAAAPVPPSSSPGLGARCHDCGEPYASPRFPDLVVPMEVWAAINPFGDGGGLLCPNCMCARASAAGIECEAVFRSGPFASDASPSPSLSTGWLEKAERKAVWAALLAMVEDIHSAQDNLTSEEWGVADALLKRLTAEADALLPVSDSLPAQRDKPL